MPYHIGSIQLILIDVHETSIEYDVPTYSKHSSLGNGINVYLIEEVKEL